MVRSGLPDLIRQLNSLGRFEEITLTTNGSRLKDLARPLKEAGLTRVNVSLDTLDSERFNSLTGGRLENTLQGIESALDADLTPLKINAVLQKDSWQRDVPALIEFARLHDIEIRFIELLPIGSSGAWSKDRFVPATEVMRYLNETGKLIPLPYLTGAPARKTIFRTSDRDVIIGWIAPQSESFCEGCNRLRLDSRGRLRRCLIDPETLNLTDILLNQGSETAVSALKSYMIGKTPPVSMSSENLMLAVGG